MTVVPLRPSPSVSSVPCFGGTGHPSLHVEGGVPIGGSMRPSGNKNAALPLLAAALLCEEEVVLHNVPDIADVRAMLALLDGLGMSIGRRSDRSLVLSARGLAEHEPDADLCRSIRASILLAGPLLARRGHLELPPPGGDIIGRRRLDTHVLALRALGAQVELGRDGTIRMRAPSGLRGAEVFLDEASVTATENTLMAAALAHGETTILNAASEPHVQDLCFLLQGMGVQIEGVGTNRLRIQGVDRVAGVELALGPDLIEIGSFIVLAAATGGELSIHGVRESELRSVRLAFAKLGVRFEVEESGELRVPGGQSLRVEPDLGNSIPQIADGPWPALPADLTSILVVAATQSEGVCVVHEKMFESRLFFVDRLLGMGARLVLCDPHRVVVTGRSQLYGQELVSPDIRAGMALLIAALCADGESIIHNVQQIDRGYERIDQRLASLGAQIYREVQ